MRKTREFLLANAALNLFDDKKLSELDLEKIKKSNLLTEINQADLIDKDTSKMSNWEITKIFLVTFRTVFILSSNFGIVMLAVFLPITIVGKTQNILWFIIPAVIALIFLYLISILKPKKPLTQIALLCSFLVGTISLFGYSYGGREVKAAITEISPLPGVFFFCLAPYGLFLLMRGVFFYIVATIEERIKFEYNTFKILYTLYSWTANIVFIISWSFIFVIVARNLRPGQEFLRAGTINEIAFWSIIIITWFENMFEDVTDLIKGRKL